MFYVANVITLSVFLELPRKFNLLVRYKLNRFWSPRVNQFDTRALAFGGYARFIPLDKMVYRDNGNPDLWHLIDITFIFDIVYVV